MPNKNGKISKWLCEFKEYLPLDKEDKEGLKNSSPYVFGQEWRTSEGFGGILRDFKFYGCNPSIRLKDKKWRFYINTGTSIYDESPGLRSAFRKALKKWEKAGRPTAEDRFIKLYVREHKEGKRVWRQLQWRSV